MLNTRFPRIHGDVGNPASWPMPVTFRRVDLATVGEVVVTDSIAQPVTDAMVDAACWLQHRGAGLITTSCGFLAAVHDELQTAINVPLVSSALMLLPLLRAAHGPSLPIGVLTFDADVLNRHHFGNWWAPPVLVEGIPKDGALYRTIAQDLPDLDETAAAAEAATAATRLRARAPELAAIVLECTNLPPYREQIRDAAGVPVHDLVDLVGWLLQARKTQYK